VEVRLHYKNTTLDPGGKLRDDGEGQGSMVMIVGVMVCRGPDRAKQAVIAVDAAAFYLQSAVVDPCFPEHDLDIFLRFLGLLQCLVINEDMGVKSDLVMGDRP